jgi:hypothetical protein
VNGLNWAGTSYVVANNAMECATADLTLSGSPVTATNLDVTSTQVGAVPNVYPTAGSILIDAGTAAHSAPDDFNGTLRTGTPDVGAYERTAAINPGWTPSATMKPVTGCP